MWLRFESHLYKALPLSSQRNMRLGFGQRMLGIMTFFRKVYVTRRLDFLIGHPLTRTRSSPRPNVPLLPLFLPSKLAFDSLCRKYILWSISIYMSCGENWSSSMAIIIDIAHHSIAIALSATQCRYMFMFSYPTSSMFSLRSILKLKDNVSYLLCCCFNMFLVWPYYWSLIAHWEGFFGFLV